MLDAALSYAAAILALLLLAGGVAWFYVRQFRDVVKDLVTILGSAWGAVQELVAWVRRHWIARSIRADLQGHINAWIRDLNRRLPVNLKVPEIQIKLHQTSSAMEVLKDGKLLVFLNENETAAERYSHATKFVVGAMAMPPQHRPYFEAFICEAFELTVARLMLASRDPVALAAFERHAIQPAMKDDDRVARYCLRFETIQEAGFFTRVLWPEMHEFGSRLQGTYPSQRLRAESGRFIRWLHDMAARPAGDTSVPLDFLSRNIRVAFCLVRDNRRELPVEVYEGHISRDLDEGCRRVYVLARGQSIPLVMGIAEKFRKDHRVARVLVHRFDQHMIGQSVLDEALKGSFQPPSGREARVTYDRLARRYDDDEQPEHVALTETRRAVCATICAVGDTTEDLGDEFEELTADVAAPEDAPRERQT